MADSEDVSELLFFDTFSHEVDTDINLDLVQFPKPVYITQVRIIPLGARVQADFPGGVRLGATNPSKFDIEFFVNDLGMPGASTFENLGHLEYNQNDCIHLECTQEKIPTDGLVLRGWYSTITLAVYGILTNAMAEHIASPPPPPCEPAGLEEIVNLGTEAPRTTSLPDEVLKEDWKEPLPGELLHGHKASASEDVDYINGRGSSGDQHYHQQHSGDERERCLRKTSHSSERSASRNRTLSESNDREYVRRSRDREREREKSTRDWSRSPEYSRRTRRKRSERSRSDIEETHKWPRTPPASIDSPTRPRSPDYTDEESPHYKSVKSRPYMRSTESLVTATVSAGPETHAIDDEETPGTPGEQYEPILSDDEIMGDDDDDSSAAVEQTAADEFELELQAAAVAAKPAIVEFDAFRMPVQRFESDMYISYGKDLENLKLLLKKFELQTKCESLLAFKEANTTVEERESFVFLCEQLINQLAYLTQNFKRRNYVLQQLFDCKERLQRVYAILHIALDFEAACAQTQPAFKIRHIKVGARLTELLAPCAAFFDYLLYVQEFDPFAFLLGLYQQDYMALSIKLLLLKAIYALLDSKPAMQHFLGPKLNGYRVILELLQTSRLTRTKCALQTLVKKLHLNEAISCLSETCTQLFVLSDYYSTAVPSTEPLKVLEAAIEQLLDALTQNALSYQQPRRFLPVSKKFEIVTDFTAQRNFANALQSFFVQHSLGESLLLLLSNAPMLPTSLLLRTIDLIQALLQSHVGIDYLVDDCFETTQLLIAVLLGIDEIPMVDSMVDELSEFEVKSPKDELDKETQIPKVESNTDDNGDANSPETFGDSKKLDPEEDIKPNLASIEEASSLIAADEARLEVKRPYLQRLQRLGIELAYKVQTRYHLDAIIFNASTTGEYDPIKLATHLHALYSQTCSAAGRQHTIEMIGLNNNLQVFMDLIKKEQRLQAQRHLASPGAKYKSPVLSYAVDMVDCCVRYCENLDYLIEHGAHILELAKNHESFEPSVSAVLQEMFVYIKPLEVINIFAYDDITPLVEVITRSLEYITTFPGDLIMGLRILRNLAIGPVHKSDKSADSEELKYRFVTLQFFAADGVQTLLHILEQICAYFEQPGLHAPALITTQGVHCCQILLPTLQILREMLSLAIQCRDVEFKDLTAIDHLMRTYYLLHYFPGGSQAANEVELAKREIIQTLLAYTQPNEQDEESLHKSLWTQMIREILKNIDSPSTFIPGLQILAELLPLPLPIPLSSGGVNGDDVQSIKSQAQRLITERKLWSAHLHPQSAQISKMIESIVPSSFPQLSDLLTRVCLQLADLAPNMTLLISKTLTDLLCAEWSNVGGVPSQPLARLLFFFARLVAFPSLKISTLSILSGKLWDLFQAVLTLKSPSDIGLKCQVSVHRILESFLDSEISLISPQTDAVAPTTPALNLASALPPKELIPRIVEAIFSNLMQVEVTHEVSALGVRNLVILTEHDITFYHLALVLRQKSLDFQQWLQKIVELNEVGPYNSNIESLVLLLRSLTQIEDVNGQYTTLPTRTLKLTTKELVQVIGFSKDAGKPHILERMRVILEQNKEENNEALLNDIQQLCSQVESLESGSAMETEEEMSTEPFLPQTESIVTQYDARPIFSSYEPSTDEVQLSAPYWLNTLNIDDYTAEDFETQYERVTCDLTELAQNCLPAETNLIVDCKRVLHLSASPQSNRERTPTAPCFRTRRVEVEPSTGRPEKKIYVTPVRGRGFSRPPPTRGDLFRSRPPNTSRPPSLHVDDFLALETCGAQPTGPTGYNKIPPLMRGSRVGRNRGSRLSAAAAYRKAKVLRTSSPSAWNDGGSPHYRTATAEPHFGSDMHYSTSHFGGRPRGRGSRVRSYLR